MDHILVNPQGLIPFCGEPGSSIRPPKLWYAILRDETMSYCRGNDRKPYGRELHFDPYRTLGLTKWLWSWNDIKTLTMSMESWKGSIPILYLVSTIQDASCTRLAGFVAYATRPAGSVSGIRGNEPSASRTASSGPSWIWILKPWSTQARFILLQW